MSFANLNNLVFLFRSIPESLEMTRRVALTTVLLYRVDCNASMISVHSQSCLPKIMEIHAHL